MDLSARPLQDLTAARGTRGQSTVIGVVLLFGLMIVGAMVIIMFGASATTDVKNELEVDRAEKALTQFDSQVAMVALGTADVRSATLPDEGNGDYQVTPQEGWMRVTLARESGAKPQLMNTTLGRLSYTVGDETVAYQGGGVFRASPRGGHMISPPEVHYRGDTLTLRAITITGAAESGDRVSIRPHNRTTVYPNPAKGANFSNPVTNSKVNITIKSRLYRGWGEYFETRFNSDVEYIPSENKVNVTLVPPPQPIELNNGIIGAGNLSIDGVPFNRVTGGVSLGGTTGDDGAIQGPVDENVASHTHLEPAGSEISAAKSRLQSEGAPGSFSEVTAGTYYVTNDNLFQTQTTFNTTNGDIELFVDGDLTAAAVGGPPGTPPELNVTGDGRVTLYADGVFHMNGQPAWGNANQVDSLVVYSHEVDRITEFYGVLYTDAVDIQGAGHDPDMTGSIVSTADTISMAGNVDVEYDESLEDTVLQEVEADYALVSYLHVSNNTVAVN